MIRWRVLIELVAASADSETWSAALAEEPPVRGAPAQCPDCPARVGGPWEHGLRETAPLDRLAGRWGCHAEDRPCAGVVRLAAEVRT